MIGLHPLTGIGEIGPGDDLAPILAHALLALDVAIHDAHVLVVTQKIVSKAEGRFVDLAGVVPSQRAQELAAATLKDPRLVELVLVESSDVVRAAPNVLITRHRTGHVMANAGIDRSNIGQREGELALLLPLDADASAERLRMGLAQHLPNPPAVVISDSFGRPWRTGVVNVAIGVSGMPAIVDHRGTLDRDGRRLEVTQVALADLAASATGLVMGEGAEGCPAVLIDGLTFAGPPLPAAALVRPAHEDLFR